tara:strand:+ start:1708 stop:2754 length:1047 start_codon:yes stop_codon:yes gene_type:complete
LKLNAKLVPYAGFEMPVQYPEGIKKEYQSIRKDVGMFDVSHMGEFEFSGENAERFLQRLTINDVSRLYNGRAQYSVMCNQNGGIIDDLILYKFKDRYFMVINASNIDKNWSWVNRNLIENVEVKNLSDSYSLIAIQGPNSRNTLENIFQQVNDLKFYHAREIDFNGEKIILSRTGYTGELGFEIYASGNNIQKIWEVLLSKGVQPCGLGVRDLLRMEMKYCLYGNDIDESTNPLEAGLSWITDFKNQFIGIENLKRCKSNGLDRNLVALKLEERGIPRKGYLIYNEDNIIGEICSGTQSLALNCGIGLGYVKNGFHNIGTKISVSIRDKKLNAVIIKPPFIGLTSLFA